MRSILLDRSLHFFKILEYDKGEWFDFWRDRYRKSFPRVVPLYEKKHGLSDEKIREILESFNRSFLDRLRFKVESELKEHKKKA
ncbi:MAG TPA: GAF domain-containing protein, partial [Thermotogales bacterium]|nr:GAF domain-containing protein [Thermotogales bacterium]